jgi:hypothetical protein
MREKECLPYACPAGTNTKRLSGLASRARGPTRFGIAIGYFILDVAAAGQRLFLLKIFVTGDCDCNGLFPGRVDINPSACMIIWIFLIKSGRRSKLPP